MLSLVSVDELPVPSDKRIHNPDLDFYVETTNAELGGGGPVSVPNVVKPRSAIHV